MSPLSPDVPEIRFLLRLYGPLPLGRLPTGRTDTGLVVGFGDHGPWVRGRSQGNECPSGPPGHRGPIGPTGPPGTFLSVCTTYRGVVKTRGERPILLPVSILETPTVDRPRSDGVVTCDPVEGFGVQGSQHWWWCLDPTPPLGVGPGLGLSTRPRPSGLVRTPGPFSPTRPYDSLLSAPSLPSGVPATTSCPRHVRRPSLSPVYL